ncbi:hypothetical protein [Lacticaseibacillus zhaodongensis]|uniref:hypothetical protein n=1 Tax=Lacticaseibacillus zhaodongensis TaxID=2668065 RepID=UPI0012D2D453|nr:hypothetical protein [Lacticaseibacillus zhaodongensis]
MMGQVSTNLLELEALLTRARTQTHDLKQTLDEISRFKIVVSDVPASDGDEPHEKAN